MIQKKKMCHKENQRVNRTGVNRLHLLDTKAFGLSNSATS